MYYSQQRVVHQRVIPQLVAEFRNHKMIPFILPIVLLIADDCTMREYSDLILPILIPVFMIHDPIQVWTEIMNRAPHEYSLGCHNFREYFTFKFFYTKNHLIFMAHFQ